MARLTKSDIERKLLTGMAVAWDDGSKKKPQLLLSDPKARSLFQFLLKSSVRSPAELPDTFIKGLTRCLRVRSRSGVFSFRECSTGRRCLHLEVACN